MYHGVFALYVHAVLCSNILCSHAFLSSLLLHQSHISSTFQTLQIEPESQTGLLDATMNTKGVLLAGVPGAGGYDAIFAVTLGESSSNVAETWSKLNVLPMLVREDPRGVTLESGDPRAKEISSAISSIHI